MSAPQHTQEPTLEPSFWRRHALKLVVSIVIAGGFVWTFRKGGLPLLPSAGALSRVSAGTWVGFLTMLTGMQLFRATRWRHLLSPLGHVPLGRILAVSYVGFTAILLMPLRAGEFVRPYLIKDDERISLGAATGTIGAERVIDGLFLTGLLGCCLQFAHPLSPLPDHIGKLPIPVATVPFYAYASLVGFLCAFALMALFYWRPAVGHRLAEATLGLFSHSLAERACDFVTKVADGLRFLPSFRHFGPFLFETLLYWGFNVAGTLILARGCGIEAMTLTQACVVMGVLGVGILVPAGPGLFGAFQWSIYAGLAMFYADDLVLGPGATFVFLIYGVQFTWHVISAAAILVFWRPLLSPPRATPA